MKIELRSAEFFLKANQPMSLRSARNIRIVCTSGIIWITVSGQTKDVFLSSGQYFQIPNNALTVIESIGEGKVCLTKPRRLNKIKCWIKNSQKMTGRLFQYFGLDASQAQTTGF
jgi:hypothetical protein